MQEPLTSTSESEAAIASVTFWRFSSLRPVLRRFTVFTFSATSRWLASSCTCRTQVHASSCRMPQSRLCSLCDSRTETGTCIILYHPGEAWHQVKSNEHYLLPQYLCCPQFPFPSTHPLKNDIKPPAGFCTPCWRHSSLRQVQTFEDIRWETMRWARSVRILWWDETSTKFSLCFQDNKFISRQMFTTEYVSVNKPSPEQSASYLCLCQRDIREFHGIFATQTLSPTALWWRGFRSVICHFKRFFAGGFSFSVKTRPVSCWVANNNIYCVLFFAFTVLCLLSSKIYSPGIATHTHK